MSFAYVLSHKNAHTRTTTVILVVVLERLDINIGVGAVLIR